jgi:hypothetical protein
MSRRVKKQKVSSKRKTKSLDWSEADRTIGTLRKVEKAAQDEKDVILPVSTMEVLKPPYTIEEWQKIRETTVSLMGNPYCDEFMFRTLSDKLDKIDAEINKLKK